MVVVEVEEDEVEVLEVEVLEVEEQEAMEVVWSMLVEPVELETLHKFADNQPSYMFAFTRVFGLYIPSYFLHTVYFVVASSISSFILLFFIFQVTILIWL